MSGQDSITVPVVYIEAFVMMLGAFIIGYVIARAFTRIHYKGQLEQLKKKIAAQEEIISSLKTTTKENSKVNYRKDRMDQEYEQQVQFQKRAFSDHVLTKSTDTPEIDFDRIGVASIEEKDDLQQIVGIGPYTEAKLNNLGIYTFEQISRFNNEDVDIITELIKFFPDRIKNDRWVTKAASLKNGQTTTPSEDQDSSTEEEEEEEDEDLKKKETKTL